MERRGICQDCSIVAKRYVMAGKWLCRTCYNKRCEAIRAGRKEYGRPVVAGRANGPRPLWQPGKPGNGRTEEIIDMSHAHAVLDT